MITMMIKLYITTFIYFIIIDLIGISLFVRKVYEKNLPKDVKLDFNLPVALIFYFIFVFGLVYFVIAPNKDNGVSSIIMPSIIYGLVTYATYALTVKAVFNTLNTQIIVFDIIWGMALCLSISVLTIYTRSKFEFLN